MIMMAFPSRNGEPSFLQRQTAAVHDAHSPRSACLRWALSE
jgi:hypothetical protein